MKVLGVCFTARNLQPCLYWVNRLNLFDKLLIMNYTSHDLAFSIDANKLGYEIWVDARAGCLHFGDTSHFLDFKGKQRYVKLITAEGEEKIIREDDPYY